MATTSLRIVSARECASWARNIADLCASKDRYDSLMTQYYGPDFQYTHEMLLEDSRIQREHRHHRVQYGALAGAVSSLVERGSSPVYSIPDAYFLLLECDWVSSEAAYLEDLEGPERSIAEFIDAAQERSLTAHSESQAEFQGRLQGIVSPRLANDALLMNKLVNRSSVTDAAPDDTEYPAWADSTCSGYLTHSEIQTLASPAEDSLLVMYEAATAASDDEQEWPRKAAQMLRLLADLARDIGEGAICIAHTE